MNLQIRRNQPVSLRTARAIISETDVALSYDSNVSNDLNGSTPQHVVFLIRQSLRGRDDDGVPGVRPERIKVLHVAANDRVLSSMTEPSYQLAEQDRGGLSSMTHVGSISNDLVFDLLPPLETLLDKNLRTQTEGLCTQIPQFLFIVGET